MFLRCNPSVFVVEENYVILVNAKEQGIISVLISGVRYYEENSGALSSQKTFAKICVPKEALNNAKEYTVAYKKTVKRQSYFSKFEDEVTATFEFKPLTKQDDINLYFLADIHEQYSYACKTADFFGEEVDLYLIGGDFCEFNTWEDYFKVGEFLGDISKGKIPVVFARGNHDTRGEIAECFTNYFPSVGTSTFYKAPFNQFDCIVCDLGEDKWDDSIEYGGSNDFHSFRERELQFLSKLNASDKLTFALSHVCPAKTTLNEGDIFDIERDIYGKFNDNFERLNLAFMVTGHIHATFILPAMDKASILPHSYPVIVGSDKNSTDVIGTALTITNGKLLVKFTNSNKEILTSHELDLKTKSWNY